MEPAEDGLGLQPEQQMEGMVSGNGHDATNWQMPDPAENNTNSIDSFPRKSAKRRTKTGCLTCRRRRIKCGEEKPICNNCIKSKRECEGYSQPFVFRRPVGISGVPGAFGPNHQPHAPMQSMPMTVPLFSEYDNNFLSQQGLQAGSHLPVLAPRPSDLSTPGQTTFPTASATPYGETQAASTVPFHYPPVSARASLPPTSETVVGPPPGAPSPGMASQGNSGQLRPAPVENDGSFGPNFHSPSETYNLSNFPSVHWKRESIQSFASQGGTYNTGHDSILQEQHLPSQTEISASFGIPAPGPSANPAQGPEQSRTREPFFPGQLSSELEFDYVEKDDDYSDIEMNEDMSDKAQNEGFNQLSLIMSSAERDARQLRSFTTHLNEPNMLATYRPTFGSSPLTNPKTARIFAHFIHSTGPSLSIFERHPADSSIMLGAPVPTAQQGLWTYTLPLLALENQALLQAILAVSSLHISFLQRAPSTPALKHYHYALRKIGKAVSLPSRRKQVGTLAAILLLGYYEVIAAEYTKWGSHMGGSSQLLREIDFASMTRDLRSQRRRMQAEREHVTRSNLWFTDKHFYDDGAAEDDPFAEKESSIDDGFIGSIMGRAINYDEFGQVDEGKTRESKKHFTRKDIDNYRIQCDLLWWYNKQDIIQTLISGNKLFTPYYKWGQCPPRAGAGRLDAVYGSADHLWLLMARLADFGYRDRKRKLKAGKASGSEWRPGPELSRFMGRFASGGQGPRSGANENGKGPEQTRGGPGSQPSVSSPQVGGRPMYGMVPPLGPIRLSSAFANSADRNEKFGEEGDEDERDVTYKDAEREWEDVLAAFDTFAHGLGRDYLPLPPDSTPPISTPFGPALQYRTNTIAAIWGFYYAGRIMLHRFHPSMPPAMMVASGVAAPTTAECAQTIGRIAGGIYYPQRYNFEAGRLSPNLGTCLVELTVPIYFAAVQYTDFEQRRWIVTQMGDVSRLTGWESANVMVRGCESAWVVAAKQGRGPPYERMYQDEQSTPFNASQKRDEGSVQEEGNPERRFVAISNAPRKPWAMGILSLEDDVLNLDIEDR